MSEFSLFPIRIPTPTKQRIGDYIRKWKQQLDKYYSINQQIYIKDWIGMYENLPQYTDLIPNPDWVEWVMGYNQGYTCISTNERFPVNPIEHNNWIADTEIPKTSDVFPDARNRLSALGNSIVPQAALIALERCYELITRDINP